MSSTVELLLSLPHAKHEKNDDICLLIINFRINILLIPQLSHSLLALYPTLIREKSHKIRISLFSLLRLLHTVELIVVYLADKVELYQ